MYWVVRYTNDARNWQHVERYDVPYRASVALRREATRYTDRDAAHTRARWLNMVGWVVRVVYVTRKRRRAAA